MGRFRRRREGQERDLVREAASEAVRVLGPWHDGVERVALGGDRSAVSRALAADQNLAWVEPLALERFFTVPDPRRRVLEELPYQLYAAKVVEEARALAGEVRDGGAVGGLALAPLDERMASRARRAPPRGRRPCRDRGRRGRW